ncbi:MAG: hypothetical protein JKY66_03565 [Spongiibacteraceae bacterium]|nr:hypothetical protein [Spongiibacteraceae bacterium]
MNAINNAVIGVRVVVVLTGLLFVEACGNREVVVDTDFPSPLVKKLPLTIGIVYGEDFRSHSYEDSSDVKGEIDWVLKTGSAQVALFNKLVGGMFDQTVLLDKFPDSVTPDVDAVFSPVIEDIQIAVPLVTRVNVFEIWIRYNLRMYTPEGEVIADWIMSAYGKTPTRFLKTKAQAVEQATIVALRDGGANFVIGFEKVPEVRRWLDGQLKKIPIEK